MRLWLLFTVCLVNCIVLRSPSSAEVKVILKNDRVIVADSCRNANDNLICEKLGGTFEFAREDILDVKKMTLQLDNVRVNSAQESDLGTEQQKETLKSANKSGSAAKPKEGGFKGADSERERRLEQITQRKTELKAEREALLREREDLQKEMTNNSYSLRHNRVNFNALRQKSADLESRIEKFGSELKALNEEEPGLLGSRQ